MNTLNRRDQRQVKQKRRKIKQKVAQQEQMHVPVIESNPSRWVKMMFGSTALILALFGLPVAVGLFIMLATIPEIIQDLNLIPSAVLMVTVGIMGLLLVQSGLIAGIVMGVLRIRQVRAGTLITFAISVVSIAVLLSFFAPIFRMRGIF